jgi:hypothetical protein
VPDTPELGPIGRASGQVLRVNVTAAEPETPAYVTVFFQDLLGRQVGPVPKPIVVRPDSRKRSNSLSASSTRTAGTCDR